MANENQPPFWLQIKKEYILDNFDNLTSYLCRYIYDREAVNTDYDSTLNCMKSMAEEIGDELRATPLFRPLELKYGNLMALKLLAVHILASRKTGEVPYDSILTLCSLIIRMEPRNESKTFTGLYDIMLNSIHRRKITGLGYGWSDIPTDSNKLQIFILKFQYMTFEVNHDDVSYFIDNCGLMVVPPFGMPDISTVNLNRYRTGRCYTVFNINPICRVVAKEEICGDPLNFDSVYLSMSQLLDYQKSYTAASFDKRLDYMPDNRHLPVRITGKVGFRVEAETINPAFNRLKGVVNIRLNAGRPDLIKLRENLKIGDILLVDLSEEKGYTFEIRNTFEDYYRDVACDMAGEERLAVFCKTYARGTEWLSAEGIRIGIDNSKLEELDEDGEALYSTAIRERLPIVVRLYNSPQSKNREDFNVYAEIWEIYEEDDAREIEFPEDPEMVILNSFKEYCASKCEHMSVISNFSDFKEGELKEFRLLPAIFYNFGKYVEMSPVARLKYYISAMMLSRICGNDGDADFIEYECEYLRQLVNFSSNREVKPLPAPGEIFAENKSAGLHRELIATLSHYKRNNEINTPIQDSSVFEEDEEKLVNKISALVSASNSLIGIVDDVEMNDIKHSIARLLSVEDEYIPILDDRTYYGVESINLEFKTSIVAPPYNQRKSPEETFDPEIQKWAILRTICAFMNSRSGGELLIGVNDVGYAKGVDDDIEQLYRRNYITYKDTDHYLLYIQKMLDHAFLEQDGRRRSNEITRTNVTCAQETNAEGVTIVRIKVLPYKEKIIRLAASVSERPINIADAYVRYNASSVPITEGMVHDIMKYKIRRS